MAQPETRIVRRYLRAAREHGWYALNLHGSAYSGPGRPDTLVCARGVFVAVEFKTATGRATPQQGNNIRAIRRAGGYAFIARDADLAVKAVTLCTRGVQPYMDNQLELDDASARFLAEFEASLAGDAPIPDLTVASSYEEPEERVHPNNVTQITNWDPAEIEADRIYEGVKESFAAVEAAGKLTRRRGRPAKLVEPSMPNVVLAGDDDAKWATFMDVLRRQGDMIAGLYDEIRQLRADLERPLTLTRGR